VEKDLVAPDGWEEIVSFYGDVSEHIGADGDLGPRWKRENLGFVSIPWECHLSWTFGRTDSSGNDVPPIRVTRVRVHIKILDVVEKTFAILDAEGVGARHLPEFAGAFNFRPQRGSHKLSTHSFGAALDWMSRQNRFGNTGRMNRDVVAIHEEAGWTWGGRWSRPDAMHFQFCSGY